MRDQEYLQWLISAGSFFPYSKRRKVFATRAYCCHSSERTWSWTKWASWSRWKCLSQSNDDRFRSGSWQIAPESLFWSAPNRTKVSNPHRGWNRNRRDKSVDPTRPDRSTRPRNTCSTAPWSSAGAWPALLGSCSLLVCYSCSNSALYRTNSDGTKVCEACWSWWCFRLVLTPWFRLVRSEYQDLARARLWVYRSLLSGPSNTLFKRFYL